MTETRERTNVIRYPLFDAQSGFVVEPSARWIRAMTGNVTVAGSRHALLVRDQRYLPVYYFPLPDVRTDLLEQTDYQTHAPGRGAATHYTLTVGDRAIENAAWRYLEPVPEAAELRDFIAFYWNKIDAWYEEDEEVFVHPKDPHKRVDVLQSSRHIRVEVQGETVADTRRPFLLFETGLPTRYYIPKLDVRMELLEPTEKVTACPYKGEASYWSVRVGDRLIQDLVWSYRFPLPEVAKIANLVAFFNEKADIYVDDELQEKPRTSWS